MMVKKQLPLWQASHIQKEHCCVCADCMGSSMQTAKTWLPDWLKRMALKQTLNAWFKLDKTEAKFVHVCKLFSCMLRLCIVGAVLATGFLVLVTSSSMKVLRRSTSGWISDETCFFFTGEEYGFTYELGRLEVSIGNQTFCGLTSEHILLDFATASSKSESTSFSDHFTLEYYAQFFVAVGYAMFFVGVAVVRVVNSVYQKDKGLDSFTSGLKQLWNMLLLTLLAGYLVFPCFSHGISQDTSRARR